MKALVLDDDPIDLGKMEKLLSDAGFDVFPCLRAVEAYNVFQELVSSGQELPSILVFDIRLEHPGRDNDEYGGINLAGKILMEHPLPVLFITSDYDRKEYREEIQRIGVIKPVYLPKQTLNLENKNTFLKNVYACIRDFRKKTWSGAEYLSHSQRRIGIKDDGIIRFYGKDDIILIKAVGSITHIILASSVDKPKSITIGTNLGVIGPQIGFNYLNIIRLNESYWINLEKIVSINEGILELQGGHTIENLRDGALDTLYKELLIIRTNPGNQPLPQR